MVRPHPWLVTLSCATIACSDALEHTTSAGQVIGVVNASDQTLSLIAATDFTVATRTLRALTSATPTTIDARGNVFLVPLGVADAVAVDFLVPPGQAPSASSDHVYFLAPGSGATGVAIQNDSIAWIANPNLNTVTRLNYLTGASSSMPVGNGPQAVAVAAGRVYVVNANLTGSPAGVSWLTVIDAARRTVTDSVALSGVFARWATVGGDGFLYVVDAGHPGLADGKLSIIDTTARAEVAVLNGLGASPGAVVFHPIGGRLLIASRTEGILEVNAATRAVTRGPGNGVKPGGAGVSGLAVDLRGRVYAVAAGSCAGAGVVRVLSAPPDYGDVRSVTVGVCPNVAALAATP